MGSSCDTLDGFSSFLMKDLLNGGIGGRRVWELRLCCGGCSSSAGGNKGFVAADNDSGVCLLVSDEERNELPNLDNEGVPRNPILGDGTLL